MQDQFNKSSQQSKGIEEETFKLQDIIQRYLKYWPWFIISIILVIGGTWVYLSGTSPVYESQASILVLDKGEGSLVGNLDIFSDLKLNSNGAEFYNEIEILKSRTLIQSVISDLGLCTETYLEGSLIKPDQLFYEDSPIRLKAEETSIHENTCIFSLSVKNADSFLLKEEYRENGETIEKDLGEFHFGENINTYLGTASFHKTDYWGKSYERKDFRIIHKNLNEKTEQLQKALGIGTVNKDASVLRIKISGANKKLNNAIINKLIEQHEINAVNEKNLITKNTSRFIAERMEVIEKELNKVETRGEVFKQKIRSSIWKPMHKSF